MGKSKILINLYSILIKQMKLGKIKFIVAEISNHEGRFSVAKNL